MKTENKHNKTKDKNGKGKQQKAIFENHSYEAAFLKQTPNQHLVQPNNFFSTSDIQKFIKNLISNDNTLNYNDSTISTISTNKSTHSDNNSRKNNDFVHLADNDYQSLKEIDKITNETDNGNKIRQMILINQKILSASLISQKNLSFIATLKPQYIESLINKINDLVLTNAPTEATKYFSIFLMKLPDTGKISKHQLEMLYTDTYKTMKQCLLEPNIILTFDKYSSLLTMLFTRFSYYLSSQTINNEDKTSTSFLVIEQFLCDVQNFLLVCSILRIDLSHEYQFNIEDSVPIILYLLSAHERFIYCLYNIFFKTDDNNVQNLTYTYFLHWCSLFGMRSYLFEFLLLLLLKQGKLVAILFLLSSFAPLNSYLRDYLANLNIEYCLDDNLRVLETNHTFIKMAKIPVIVIIGTILQLCWYKINSNTTSYKIFNIDGTEFVQINELILVLLSLIFSLKLSNELLIHHDWNFKVFFEVLPNDSFTVANAYNFFVNISKHDLGIFKKNANINDMFTSFNTTLIIAYVLCQKSELGSRFLDLVNNYISLQSSSRLNICFKQSALWPFILVLFNNYIQWKSKYVNDTISLNKVLCFILDRNYSTGNELSYNDILKSLFYDRLDSKLKLDINKNDTKNKCHSNDKHTQYGQNNKVSIDENDISSHNITDNCNESSSETIHAFYDDEQIIELFGCAHNYYNTAMACYQLYELLFRICENEFIDNQELIIQAFSTTKSNDSIHMIRNIIAQITGIDINRLELTLMHILDCTNKYYTSIPALFSSFAQNNKYSKAINITQTSLVFMLLPFISQKYVIYRYPFLNINYGPQSLIYLLDNDLCCDIYPTVLPLNLAMRYKSLLAQRIILTNSKINTIISWFVLFFEICAAATMPYPDNNTNNMNCCLNPDLTMILLLLYAEVGNPRAMVMLKSLAVLNNNISRDTFYSYIVLLVKRCLRSKFTYILDTILSMHIDNQAYSKIILDLCYRLYIQYENNVKANDILSKLSNYDQKKAELRFLRVINREKRYKKNQEIKEVLNTIKKFAIQNNLQSTIDLFYKMRAHENGLLDISIINKILHLCINNFKIASTIEVFNLFRKDTQVELTNTICNSTAVIKPDVVTCNIMLKGLIYSPYLKIDQIVKFLKLCGRPHYRNGYDIKIDQMSLSIAMNVANCHKNCKNTVELLQLMVYRDIKPCKNTIALLSRQILYLQELINRNNSELLAALNKNIASYYKLFSYIISLLDYSNLNLTEAVASLLMHFKFHDLYKVHIRNYHKVCLENKTIKSFIFLTYLLAYLDKKALVIKILKSLSIYKLDSQSVHYIISICNRFSSYDTITQFKWQINGIKLSNKGLRELYECWNKAIELSAHDKNERDLVLKSLTVFFDKNNALIQQFPEEYLRKFISIISLYDINMSVNLLDFYHSKFECNAILILDILFAILLHNKLNTNFSNFTYLLSMTKYTFTTDHYNQLFKLLFKYYNTNFNHNDEIISQIVKSYFLNNHIQFDNETIELLLSYYDRKKDSAAIITLVEFIYYYNSNIFDEKLLVYILSLISKYNRMDIVIKYINYIKNFYSNKHAVEKYK